jgi:ATP-dependent exoDNAse (exonuclease V) beta subunit
LAEKVAGLILSIKERHNYWGDIALLFTHSLNFHYYEGVFEKKGIPYVSSGGKSFFENREVKEILKIVDFLENPYDDINFATLFLSPIFRHGLIDLLRLLMSDTEEDIEGSSSLYDRLQQNFKHEYNDFLNLTSNWLSKRDRIPSIELIEEAIMDTNAYGILVDRKGGQKHVNINKLISLIENISEETTNFSFFYDRLNRVIKAREKNADIDIGTRTFEEENKGALHIMTVHKAKGLEFPVVILPEVDSATIKGKVQGISIERDKPALFFIKKYNGMETPLLSKLKKLKMAREEEELKRLFYVALTRAEKELYLFVPQKKNIEKNVWTNIVYDSELPRTTKLELGIRTKQEDILTSEREKTIFSFTEKKRSAPVKEGKKPSDIGKEMTLYDVENERAKIRGTILHKLFELTGTGIIRRDKTENIQDAVRRIASQVDTLFLCDNNLMKDIENEFLKVLDNKKIMEIIACANSLNEFPYSIEKENNKGEIEVVSGVMDKILFYDDEIRVYDYKTDGLQGKTEKEFINYMKEKYEKQMEEYRSAAKILFEKENVRVFLVLTSILEVAEVKK